MNEQKKVISFHPRKLSHSNSKGKYSPYRLRSKQKYSQAVDNKQKIILQEPIIKFKSLLDGQSDSKKLKLMTQHWPEPQLTCTTHFSNCLDKNDMRNQQNQALLQLIQKVEQQHQTINRNFKEISQQLRLPKLIEKDEILVREQKITSYQKNQQKILKNLQQLNYFSCENSYLKSLVESYEGQMVRLREELQQKNSECLKLLQQLSMLKILGLIHSQKEHTEIDNTNTNDEMLSLKLLPKETQEQLFFARPHQPTIIENEWNIYEDLLDKKEKEIVQLKLQNEILAEEVKLLNYTIEEKDSQIANLAKQLSKESKPQILMDRQRPSALLIASHKYSEKKVSESSFLRKQNQQSFRDIPNQTSIRTKKTNSVMVIDDEALKNLNKAHRNIDTDHRMQSRQTSIENLTEDLLSSSYKAKKSSGKDRHSMQIRKQASDTDKQKIDMGRSYLQVKAKETHDNIRQKKSEKRQAWMFSTEKMNRLELIRTTIGYKLKGFRYRFADVETQLLNHISPTIKVEQLSRYFSACPFLLSDSIIEDVLNYILKKYPKNQDVIRIDDLCHCLRELVSEYQILEEGTEKVSFARIKDFVYNYEQQLLQELRSLQEQDGLLSHKSLKAVLKQFKVAKTEVQLIVSQCCIISTDCDHLNYQQYFSLFSPDNNTTL